MKFFITEQTELSVYLENNQNYFIYTHATFHVSINSPKMWQLGRFMEIALRRTFRKQFVVTNNPQSLSSLDGLISRMLDF